MKIGDLVSYRGAAEGWTEEGVIVEVMSASHAKQWPKVKVLTKEGLEEWIVQYCKVVSK